MQSISEEVCALEEQRLAAMLAKDVTLLATFLADDMVYIHAFGQVDDRATWLEKVAGLASRYISFDRSEVNLAISDDKVVVMTAKVDLVGELNGRRMELKNILTTTWVRLAGGWKVVLSQSTPLVKI